MTKSQKSVIFGSLLGDGTIQIDKKHKGSNGIFRISHTTKDKEYLLWKYEVLKDLCRKEPTIRVRKRWGKSHQSIRFHTKALPYLTYLRKVFYRGNRRIISQKILAQLDEMALAVWFMDDGCVSILHHKKYGSRSRYIGIALHRYSDKERDMVIDYFKRRWDIDGWRKEKSGSIVIGSHKGQKFLDLIKPYIHPCMKRKIKEHPQRETSQEEDIV